MHIMKRDGTQIVLNIQPYTKSVAAGLGGVGAARGWGGADQEEVGFDQKGVKEHNSEKVMVHSPPTR